MHDGYQDSLVAVFLRGDMSCESMTAFKAETSYPDKLAYGSACSFAAARGTYTEIAQL